MSSRIFAFVVACWAPVAVAVAQNVSDRPTPKTRPRVIVVGVNGMEWDIIRPLLIRGELPNLASVITRGVYGKLRTISSPNCPKVYSTIVTGTSPEQNGITGFLVGGITANTNMLKGRAGCGPSSPRKGLL